MTQAQYSTQEQLQELVQLANKNGLYDAADVVQNLLNKRVAAHPKQEDTTPPRVDWEAFQNDSIGEFRVAHIQGQDYPFFIVKESDTRYQVLYNLKELGLIEFVGGAPAWKITQDDQEQVSVTTLRHAVHVLAIQLWNQQHDPLGEAIPEPSKNSPALRLRTAQTWSPSGRLMFEAHYEGRQHSFYLVRELREPGGLVYNVTTEDGKILGFIVPYRSGWDVTRGGQKTVKVDTLLEGTKLIVHRVVVLSYHKSEISFESRCT